MKTLKSQLQALIVSFSIITAILVLAGYFHNKSNDALRNAINQLSEIEKLIYKDMDAVHSFLLFDVIDEEFYKSGSSPNLIAHNQLFEKINYERKCFKKFEYLNLSPKVNQLFAKIEILNQKFIELQKFQLERGFNEFGLEGSMRDDINNLDKNKSISEKSILLLRRHEKDYIIQQQISYVRNHNELINNIIKSKRVKGKELALIKSYHEKFSKLVELDSKIGRSGKHGITKRMKDLQSEIGFIITDIINQGQIKQDELIVSYEYNYFSFAIFFILLSFGIGFYISHRLSRQLHHLSHGISEFVSSNFTLVPELSHKGDKSEIHILTRNFLILRDEIMEYIKDFEEKVRQQTQILTFQNMQIEEKNKKILTQKQKLLEQLQTIFIEKEMVTAQKKRLLESIEYAKLIQGALLPNEQTINKIYKNNFVFYKPKDILSGDFYWFKKIETSTQNLNINIVADCTGHGVPGALLSMLAISNLNDIILNQHEYRPDIILNNLRESFISTLHQMDNQQTMTDGLDISISVIDNISNTMYYAGANRSLFLVRQNQLEIVPGNRMPIGRYVNDTVPFTSSRVKLQDHDHLYMFTDGFEDQFGGAENNKFMRSRFRKLLLSIQNESFENQKIIISNHFSKWKGNNNQTDDVLLVGFEFKHNNQLMEKLNKVFGIPMNIRNSSLS